VIVGNVLHDSGLKGIVWYGQRPQPPQFNGIGYKIENDPKKKSQALGTSDRMYKQN
jgi:hypothetical protein